MILINIKEYLPDYNKDVSLVDHIKLPTFEDKPRIVTRRCTSTWTRQELDALIDRDDNIVTYWNVPK